MDKLKEAFNRRTENAVFKTELVSQSSLLFCFVVVVVVVFFFLPLSIDVFMLWGRDLFDKKP